MSEQATAVTIPGATRSGRQVGHWFYVSVALFMILLNLVAFGPSLMVTTDRLAPLTSLVTAHAVVSFSFLLFFLVQTTLVATGRTVVHRRIGMVGGALAVVLILLTYAMSIEMLRRGYDLSGDIQRFDVGGLPPEALRAYRPDLGISLAISVSQILSFGILVGAAIWFRGRPDVHKRLMLLAMLGILTGPPLAHMFGHWPALRALVSVVQLPSTVLLLSVSAIHDHLTARRVHPVSIWVPLAIFVWFGVWFGAIGPSAGWQGIASSLVR